MTRVFWIRLEKIIVILSPIITLITKIEGNTPLIHKVCKQLKDLKEVLMKEIPQSPLQKAEENLVLEKLDKRLKRAISNIHLSADLLNPSSQGCNLKPEELLDAINFICSLGNSMGLKTSDVQKDVADYRDREGLWRRSFIWEGTTAKEKDDEVSPLLWWRQLRGTCVLADVAIRILGAPVTSAATERTFSTFSWIHCKKRNRLTTTRAAKITYISHNWRLLNKDKTASKNTKKACLVRQIGASAPEEEEHIDDASITSSAESDDSDKEENEEFDGCDSD